MAYQSGSKRRENSPYRTLTREQFLFHEMRTTAKLLSQGYTDEEAKAAIIKDNLFQYPTEKSIKNLAGVCLRRLHAMNDDILINAVASEPSSIAKQICLYAMMKENRLVWDFMITVIGEKYRILDTFFGKVDLNSFFMRLAEQDDHVASWSDSTVRKSKMVLVRILVENEYLDSMRADHLNPVLISPLLEERIRANGDQTALIAFGRLD